MKYSILIAVGFAMILPLHAAEKSNKAKCAARPNPARVFKRKDTDHDKMLTKEEFTAKAKNASRAEKRFAKLDKNSDGKLTLAEFRGHKAHAAKPKPKPGCAKKQGKKQGKKNGKKTQP